MGELDDDQFWHRIKEGGLISASARLSTDGAIDLTGRFGAHNYAPLPVSIVRGDGAMVYDAEGKDYIDCIGAYSATSLGHNPKAIIDAVRMQLETIAVTGRAVYTPYLALFLQALCLYCDMDAACPMNTGAEAVETAIKIARKWAYTVKGVPDGQARIVVAEGNFHGRTTTIVGFSSHPQYRDDFGPFTPGFDIVPFGNIDAVRATIGPHTAAVMIEPIQAEGGIVVPPSGYLNAVRELCREANTLLILDEIQTGFCRTGRRFAWQHEDARPDLICVGKALGGGVLPVSAVLGSRAIMDVLHPGDHGSTFGGNPLACAAAIATMSYMRANALDHHVATIGQRLMYALASIAAPGIREIRGKGLLIGIEVQESLDTNKLTDALLKHGLLTRLTHHRTFRLTPPLIIDESTADDIARRVGYALRETAG